MEADDHPFSAAAVARFRARAGFRAAVEACARGSVRTFESGNDTMRWVFADRGRYMTGLAAIALLGLDALTAANLKTMLAGAGVSSPGRTTAFLDRMRDEGLLVMGRDESGALERRLVPSPTFVDAYRAHRRMMVEGLALAVPEAAPAAEALESDGYPRIETAICAFQTSHREAFQTRREDPLYILVERNASMPILFAWLEVQSAGRERLIEQATLNTAALSRRFGVSRVHVDRMVGDLAERGLLSLDPKSRMLTFSPTLSDAYEDTSARLLIAIHEGLKAAGLVQPPAHI